MYALPPLTRGTMIKRYKRFLADVTLDDGTTVTAHCPNTGSMTGCWRPGAPVELSHSNNPKRKLAWTLERVDMGGGWIGVNTARVNHVIGAAIREARIPQLAGYRELKNEPRFAADGHPGSRLDILLTDGQRRDAYVEIKNTTLLDNDLLRFPDAVTDRGRKHLELLEVAVGRGCRGVILYALNRPEGAGFEPARDIDPKYAETLATAIHNGVEALVVRLQHVPGGITVNDSYYYS